MIVGKMKKENQTDQRSQLNQLMADNDPFFAEFGRLDEEVYDEGAIPKKYKELTGLSISVASHCKECVDYHIRECQRAEASKQQMIEAIKMGVIGGGSVTFPTARYAFRKLQELEILN